MSLAEKLVGAATVGNVKAKAVLIEIVGAVKIVDLTEAQVAAVAAVLKETNYDGQ